MQKANPVYPGREICSPTRRNRPKQEMDCVGKGANGAKHFSSPAWIPVLELKVEGEDARLRLQQVGSPLSRAFSPKARNQRDICSLLQGRGKRIPVYFPDELR
jgi:hypothetical protein